jgi:probable rRNA maturation factor
MERVLKDLACPNKELSILFTDDERITQLNNRYLGRNAPTNVLAFPMPAQLTAKAESTILGDVVISVDTALREAGELGETFEFVIDRLIINGFLHLLGYDHEKSTAEAEGMEKEEKRLMALIREN